MDIYVDTVRSGPLNQFPQKKKVLLVEDNLIIKLVHEYMLIQLGCYVDTVSTGEEALLKINTPFDFILLDIELPGISGLEVAINFKQEPSHHKSRIIAVTSYNEHSFKKNFRSFGIEQVINKPLNIEKLKAVLSRTTVMTSISTN